MRGLALTNNGTLISSTIDILNTSSELVLTLGASSQVANMALGASGVTAGSFNNIIVDAKGRVTSARVFSLADITGALGYTPSNPASNSTNTGRVTAYDFQATTAVAISAQGGYLQWSRNSDGGLWLVNQKGSGIGGFNLGESTTGNTFTKTFGVDASGNAAVTAGLSVVGTISSTGAITATGVINSGSYLSAPRLVLNNSTGTTRAIYMQTSGVNRWNVGTDSGAEASGAVQLATSASSASGTNTLTFTATTGVVTGQYASGVAGIPSYTTVTAVTSTLVTLSATLTATIAAAATINFSINAGSNYSFYGFDDFGAQTPASSVGISRASGQLTANAGLVVAAGATFSSGFVTSSNTGAVGVGGVIPGTGLSMSWNLTAGGGESDLICGQGVGAIGGLSVYLSQTGNALKYVTPVFRINNTGGATITDNNATTPAGLTINAAAGTFGANIILQGNGATTPNKTLRVANGVFQTLNNAGTTVIHQIDDSGNVIQTGGLTATYGTFSAPIYGSSASFVSGMTTISGNIGSIGTGGSFPATGLTVGWNVTNGQGEVDFICGQGTGTQGGLAIYLAQTGNTLKYAAPVFRIGMTGNATVTDYSATSQAAFSVINGNSTYGANISMTGNGSVTPNKALRVNNGLLQVMNSAYTVAITTIDDVGNMTLSAGLAATTGSFSGAVSAGSLIASAASGTVRYFIAQTNGSNRWSAGASSVGETAPVSLVTTGTTPLGSMVLTFASTTGVVVGMYLSGAGAYYNSITTVTAVAATTVTLSNNPSNAVPTGATINFAKNTGSNFSISASDDFGTAISGIGLTFNRTNGSFNIYSSGTIGGTLGVLALTANGSISANTITSGGTAVLTANQAITVSGDATGTGNTAIALTLAAVGTAGTYNRVVTDSKGRVISGNTVGANTFTTGTIPVTTTTATITPANTAPVTSSAATLWTQAITPSSATTRVIIAFALFVDTSINNTVLGAGTIVTVAIYRGSTFVGASSTRLLTTNSPMPIAFEGVDVPGTTASTTYTAYIGGSAAGTIYINQTASATYGGTVGSAYTLYDTGT